MSLDADDRPSPLRSSVTQSCGSQGRATNDNLKLPRTEYGGMAECNRQIVQEGRFGTRGPGGAGNERSAAHQTLFAAPRLRPPGRWPVPKYDRVITGMSPRKTKILLIGGLDRFRQCCVCTQVCQTLNSKLKQNFQGDSGFYTSVDESRLRARSV